MAKRRKRKKQFQIPKNRKAPARPAQTVEYLLEQGTLQDMKAAKSRTAALLKYNWDYYSEVALQRSQIQSEINQALIQSSRSNFKFSKWQRAVRWKYGLHPFSTVGSLTYIGNRFNTGEGVNSEVPSFPALYIACDKDTALQETLGQEPGDNFGLTPIQLALINPQSEVIVSVSGELEKVFDLRKESSLEPFLELIKDFKISETLKQAAKFLGVERPDVVRKTSVLLETLLDKDWRDRPSNYDVPANPQVFGHLVFQAGIEGIVYPSKLTGKDCLAIFPRNFAATSSFIELDDEAPHEKVPKRIDKDSWRQCELSPQEIGI